MQQMIAGTRSSGERRLAVVPARLRFTAGIEGRVVVLWRNTIVGFVPEDRAGDLRRQLTEAGAAHLVADGEVRGHSGLWRVWVGSWPDGPVPAPAADEIVPAPTRIFGIPVSGRAVPAPATSPVGPAPEPGHDARSGEPAAPGDRWILAVGTDSWEVRDGADLDVGLLRRRIADGVPGATIHLRLWQETVSIHLAEHTRVTLTDPATGAVDVLYPRSQAG